MGAVGQARKALDVSALEEALANRNHAEALTLADRAIETIRATLQPTKAQKEVVAAEGLEAALAAALRAGATATELCVLKP